jgi:uroporphyrinogen III methyltransferase/synthase
MATAGRVSLVGAGPGDPGLITVRGLERLRRAEVLIYDHLVSPRLAAEAPAAAERLYVGKEADRHTLSQEDINRLLIARAQAGKRVVRLKGGDPYVFGRGGEEAICLAEHGIPFEVVPGVTAATAALAAAGIPLTHRGRASLAVLVTGHEDPAKPASDIDWTALAQLRGTLVFYMAVRNVGAIAQALIEHGRPASTPAAMVARGTLPGQRSVAAPLDEIADRAAAADIAPPALLVVGDVVDLREALNWFERRPLFGQTVVVTRARQQASSLAERLTELGADVIECPTIRILPSDDFGPLDAALARIRSFDWIVFTSANAVEAVMGRLAARTLDARALAGVHLAAIGPATADALRTCGLFADLMPPAYTTEALLDELKPHISRTTKNHPQISQIPQKDRAEPVRSASVRALDPPEADPTSARQTSVLLPRADIAPSALQDGLEDLGAEVTAVIAYRTVADAPDPSVLERLTAGPVDWVTFTSSSTVRQFAALVGPERLALLVGRVRFAAIGPQTSAAARALGLPIAAEAAEQTLDGLIAALVAASHQPPANTGPPTPAG